MNKTCKKCGRPINKGKYCNRCLAERNRKKGNAIKGTFFTGILSFAIYELARGILGHFGIKLPPKKGK